MPNAIDVEVGNRVRLQRKLKGITQKALTTTLGIPFQQVQKYKRA